MRIQKRSNNIVEIQMGTHFSNTSDTKLCGEDNFEENSWVTQPRKLKYNEALSTLINV